MLALEGFLLTLFPKQCLQLRGSYLLSIFPQTVLALEGFLLVLYRRVYEFRIFEAVDAHVLRLA